MKALALTLALCTLQAQAAPELRLLAEHVVDGMPTGNLSGLSRCQGMFWAVSDREDHTLYRLNESPALWSATAVDFDPPEVPSAQLTAYQRTRNQLSSWLRGGILDYEGIACDQAGNQYVVSETYSSVLRIEPNARIRWLNLPERLYSRAHELDLLQEYNAGFEGVAINPMGDDLWLAAERDPAGLIRLAQTSTDTWACQQDCVIRLDTRREPSPADLSGDLHNIDIGDLTWHAGKLYSLERTAHRICRHDLAGAQEACWSYATGVLTPSRRYNFLYGLAEALWLDEDRAWIGIDNNQEPRADGERRPVIYEFAAPPGGWDAP